MGWTTLSVKDDTAARFKDLKSNVDTSEDLSADRFLTLLLNGWEHGTKDDGDTNGNSINERELAASTADYIMEEYDLPAKIAGELR